MRYRIRAAADYIMWKEEHTAPEWQATKKLVRANGLG
jgi:hypothetical protein